MRRYLPLLPTALTLAATLALVFYGPIAQLAHFHDFADTRGAGGIANAADVLSNIPFALVGLWGLARLATAREHPALSRGWTGYMLFFAALVLTAIGSSWYHLAPDNTRLIFDRLPIALASAGLLAAVQAETTRLRSSLFSTVMLSAAAIASVGWWAWTDHILVGDLRFYLLLQAGPVVLIPLWQWIYRAPKSDRIAFALAIGCYVLAKGAELADHQILATLGMVSGHTLKHLLAALGAAIVASQVTRRMKQPASRRLAAILAR